MIILESDKYEEIVIIPVAYNLFLDNYHSEDETLRFNTDNMMNKNDIGDLITCINKYSNKKYIAIDMKNIHDYTSREFAGIEVKCNLKNVLFYNVQKDCLISNKMQEDINNIHIIEENNLVICFNEEMATFIREKENFKKLIDIEQNKITEVIEQVTDKEVTFLDSSGIYSNMYVDIKKIFLKYEDYSFISYKLAEKVKDKFQEIDALVVASKTGAILANLLGQLLGEKVVYCVGVGPKFALCINSIKNIIIPHKKYLYVFDFICLGTELKILNALVKSSGANLIGGIGIASHIDCEGIEDKTCILFKVISLVNLNKVGIDYQIAVSREILEDNLNK